jgi:hypothetical protein
VKTEQINEKRSRCDLASSKIKCVKTKIPKTDNSIEVILQKKVSYSFLKTQPMIYVSEVEVDLILFQRKETS